MFKYWDEHKKVEIDSPLHCINVESVICCIIAGATRLLIENKFTLGFFDYYADGTRTAVGQLYLLNADQVKELADI